MTLVLDLLRLELSQNGFVDLTVLHEDGFVEFVGWEVWEKLEDFLWEEGGFLHVDLVDQDLEHFLVVLSYWEKLLKFFGGNPWSETNSSKTLQCRKANSYSKNPSCHSSFTHLT